MSTDLSVLQARLQHEFVDRAILEKALTHRSFSADHNERLEFLGDAVLNLAISDLLFRHLSDLPEGGLSRIRANLVKQDTLHQIAVELGVPDHIKLGEGEQKSGGHKRPSILADALEALIGAVYLEGGYDAAQAAVQQLFAKVQIEPEMQASAKDPKTELQEWLQARKMRLPLYRIVGTTGVAHKQTFDVECEVTELRLTERGIGSSRRVGEQAAALAMLQTLKTHGKL
jgi:ribonuclease-3